MTTIPFAQSPIPGCEPKYETSIVAYKNAATPEAHFGRIGIAAVAAALVVLRPIKEDRDRQAPLYKVLSER
jgi:hypothetical protein